MSKKILDEETKRKEEIQVQIIKQWVRDNYKVSSRRKPLRDGKISAQYIEDVIYKSSKRKYSDSYMKKLISRRKKEIISGTASRLKYVEENIRDLIKSNIGMEDAYYKDAINRLYDIQRYQPTNNNLFGFILKNGYFDEFQEKLDNVTLSDAIILYSPDNHSYVEYIEKYTDKVDRLMTDFVAEKLGYTK